jgi:hypothetical protein
MIDNLEMAHAGLVPGLGPVRRSCSRKFRRARFRSASESICVHVARVSCPDKGRVRPEAFIEPASSGGKPPKGLAIELTTYQKSDSISRHTPREIIGLTYTKQTIEVKISRYKIRILIFVDLSSALSAKTDLPNKRHHAGR